MQPTSRKTGPSAGRRLMPESPARIFETAADEGRWVEAEAIARSALTEEGPLHAWAVSAMVRCALARGDHAGMRVWLDRADRIAAKDPDVTDFLASMLLAAGDAEGALAQLGRAGEEDPAARLPGGSAWALAWRMTGRAADAAALAETLLRRHPVPPDAPLAALAGVLAADVARPGWMGSPGGEVLIGALASDLPAETEIQLDGPAPRRWTAQGFRDRFGAPGFTLPVEGAGPWTLRANGRTLLGGGLTLPKRRVEGVVDVEGRQLCGWAASPGDPRPLPVLLTDSAGRSLELPVEAKRDEDGRQRFAFSCNLGKSGLAPGRLAVTAGGIALAGSPVAWRQKGGADIHPIAAVPPRRRKAIAAADPVIDVVIPVYGGRDVTLACLDRVLAATAPDEADIVVVDDGSPDPALAAALDALAAAGRITLLRNETNLGFPAAVNRGMALHEKRDVVLLNSDASVPANWLGRLKAAAYLAAETGTVTALSNEASICSYGPDDPAQWPSLDRLAERVNAGVTVELPTGVGFCMFIRRDCLAETGLFSETLFGRGYGEENEFCLRARRLGWRHVAAADLLVGHVGGASFGSSRHLLQDRNLRVLERLNPGYQELVEDFSGTDPLAPARRALDLARWRAADGRPAILLMTLGLEGGATRHVEERRAALAAQGRRVLILAPATPRRDGYDETLRCRLADPERPELRDLVFDSDAEFETLAALLASVPVVGIEIHHSLKHHPRLLDLPARLGMPYDMVLHDYHWLCPQVALTDESGGYCGEPQPSLPHCEACLVKLGSETGEDITVEALRRRSGRLLAQARRVIAPARDVADRYRRYFPGLSPEIVAWDSVPAPRTLPNKVEKRIRVAVIGAIGPHKGYDVLKACAEDAAARDLPLDFIVVGYSSGDGGLFATGRIHVTGRYEEDEAEALVRRQDAALAFIPSVCPETWCYALSLAWQAGLPAVAFDIGAQAERIRASGTGGVLPFGLKPAAINDTLLALSGSFMVEGRSLSTNQTAQEDSSMSQITATPQEMTLTPGFYAITVIRGGARQRPGQMALPAILVSTPPGSEANAQILSSHAGGWLTRAGDTVMLKVSGDTPVLLTSYKDAQAPNDTLDIQFSRVDGPAPGVAAAVQAASLPIPTVEILAHVQRLGDQRYESGAWVGAPGRHMAIEGFAIAPGAGIAAHELEYKAVTSQGWETPWTPAGQYCGTRQQATPLIGFAVRLTGQAAQRFDVQYEASFVNGGRSGPVRNGAPCRSDVIGASLDGILLTFSGKA